MIVGHRTPDEIRALSRDTSSEPGAGVRANGIENGRSEHYAENGKLPLSQPREELDAARPHPHGRGGHDRSRRGSGGRGRFAYAAVCCITTSWRKMPSWRVCGGRAPPSSYGAGTGQLGGIGASALAGPAIDALALKYGLGVPTMGARSMLLNAGYGAGSTQGDASDRLWGGAKGAAQGCMLAINCWGASGRSRARPSAASKTRV